MIDIICAESLKSTLLLFHTLLAIYLAKFELLPSYISQQLLVSKSLLPYNNFVCVFLTTQLIIIIVISRLSLSPSSSTTTARWMDNARDAVGGCKLWVSLEFSITVILDQFGKLVLVSSREVRKSLTTERKSKEL